MNPTKIVLKLVDNGSFGKPMEILKDVGITSCGTTTYKYTFAIIDFGGTTSYDVILGCPFICQLGMIRDWHLPVFERINKPH